MSDQQPEKFLRPSESLQIILTELQTENTKLKEIIGKQQEQLKSNQEFIGTLIQTMEDKMADVAVKQNQLRSTIETGLTPIFDALHQINKVHPSFVASDSEHTEINSNN